MPPRERCSASASVPVERADAATVNGIPSASAAACRSSNTVGSTVEPRVSTGGLRKVRVGLIWSSIFGLALCGVRALEFTTLNIRWDDSAYGSVVWMLLGLHTFNLVTDVADTLVLTAVMFKEPMEGKRFVDVAENSGYWDFIVLSWIPIYAVIYWAPRF